MESCFLWPCVSSIPDHWVVSQTDTALVWFAWSANFNSIHWAVPTLGGTFLAMSTVLLFSSYLSYLGDTYLMYVNGSLFVFAPMHLTTGNVERSPAAWDTRLTND